MSGSDATVAASRLFVELSAVFQTVNVMNMRLADLDRQAVDVMLDHRASVDGNSENPAFVPVPSDDDLRHRISSVGKVLSLLGAMPAENLPVDLVAKTMRRIDQSKLDPMRNNATIPDLFSTDRPNA